MPAVEFGDDLSEVRIGLLTDAADTGVPQALRDASRMDRITSR